MKNLGNMMKQAKQMQQNMQAMQQKLEETEMEGSSGGGLVSVTMNGKHHVSAVKISPEAVDKDDIETLEDMLTAAFNDAAGKLHVFAEEEMKKATGGMNLPF